MLLVQVYRKCPQSVWCGAQVEESTTEPIIEPVDELVAKPRPMRVPALSPEEDEATEEDLEEDENPKEDPEEELEESNSFIASKDSPDSVDPEDFDSWDYPNSD
ncbi:hypothetical protein FNV43_RR24564 [Rhamnella rubrinervis]|uniref:Uncharacterized protein n=1 Tax=Rhamnella rubrinervis TaxID=2594499 RepID=A0A8K0DYB8_9ROSA|nr:hypothetical protein FNV43_RR24564 [Rhamnella rubrinervis]